MAIADKDSICVDCENIRGCRVDCDKKKMHDKLMWYVDKEERGQLFVFPCGIGDTVWFIPTSGGKPIGYVFEDKVQMLGVTLKGIHIRLRNHKDHNKTHMLGKTVFLTKEEAEQALEQFDN